MRLALGLCLGFVACFFPVRSDAEDPLTQVVGKWVSQDQDNQPINFAKDGAFNYGFLKKKGDWVMATGTYTISAAGEIKAGVKYGNVNLGPHFTLKDGVIHGSR